MYNCTSPPNLNKTTTELCERGEVIMYNMYCSFINELYQRRHLVTLSVYSILSDQITKLLKNFKFLQLMFRLIN